MKMNEFSVENGRLSRRFLPWLLLLFFASGFAALIYEIVWLQLLELVIGSSGISVGVLLGAFMGGMCLGSLLLPRWISPKVHPLRVYAFLELGIGIIGIAVLFGMPLAAELYARLHWHGVMARALLASICLIPPTMLMGATLPAAARFVESTPKGVSWMGFFYGGNIAGAVAGSLLTGFFLLRIYDMPTATFVACTINIVAALAALLLATKSSHRPVLADAAQPSIRGPRSSGPVYLAIALSGLGALGAEVVWTRLLSLLMGATVYSFSIILAVFLFGLGLGSSAGSLLARISSRPKMLLGICQMLLAGAIAWAAFMISHSLPYWPINPSLYTSNYGPWYVFQIDLLRAAWTILPSTLLWGASFPLAIAALASENRDPGRLVGGVYAANTIGSILGALGFSLLIIPILGTQWAERILIIVAACAALAALVSVALEKLFRESADQKTPGFSFPGITATLAALIAVVLLVFSVAKIPWVAVAWGRYSATYMAQCWPDMIGENESTPKGNNSSQWFCTYVGEGMNVSVAVTRSAAGARYFHGAGKVQASSQAQDMRLQRMLGHLSALACNSPRKVESVLVIACGAGVTAGSFVPYPNIKKIVICDIEPLVPKTVAPMFGKENYHIVDGIAEKNPHIVNGKEVTVVYDDGRHYIRTLPEDAKFDVITSDPIDPWVKGSAALNTVEFYEMCRRHLKPGGVMSLWAPLYESNMSSAKSMFATFFQVFPNGMLFSNDEHLEGYDAVLLGGVEPSRFNLEALNQMLEEKSYLPVKESLMDVGFGTGNANFSSLDRNVVIDLLATYAAKASDLQRWTADAQINRDKNLRLQYLAGMWFNSYVSTSILQSILESYKFPDDVFVGSNAYVEMLRQTLANAGRREIYP
jgi:spermidine synthase